MLHSFYARERPFTPRRISRTSGGGERNILVAETRSKVHIHGQHAGEGGEAVNLGPRGGNLEAAGSQPEARRSPLNANIDPYSGLPQLHRKNGFTDTAVVGRKNEQPWHRLMAFMMLANRTDSEIAMAADVSIETVRQVKANRWFQELLSTLANNQGEDVV